MISKIYIKESIEIDKSIKFINLKDLDPEHYEENKQLIMNGLTKGYFQVIDKYNLESDLKTILYIKDTGSFLFDSDGIAYKVNISGWGSRSGGVSFGALAKGSKFGGLKDTGLGKIIPGHEFKVGKGVLNSVVFFMKQSTNRKIVLSFFGISSPGDSKRGHNARNYVYARALSKYFIVDPPPSAFASGSASGGMKIWNKDVDIDSSQTSSPMNIHSSISEIINQIPLPEGWNVVGDIVHRQQANEYYILIQSNAYVVKAQLEEFKNTFNNWMEQQPWGTMVELSTIKNEPNKKVSITLKMRR